MGSFFLCSRYLLFWGEKNTKSKKTEKKKTISQNWRSLLTLSIVLRSLWVLFHKIKKWAPHHRGRYYCQPKSTVSGSSGDGWYHVTVLPGHSVLSATHAWLQKTSMRSSGLTFVWEMYSFRGYFFTSFFQILWFNCSFNLPSTMNARAASTIVILLI